MSFNGLNVGLGNLAQLSDAKSRSISMENQTGEKGKGGMAPAWEGGPARDLGQGWKCSPCVEIKSGETHTVANISGPGAITHIWMTCHESTWRDFILRMYWDGEDTPSVEAPIGAFFCNAWQKRGMLNSLPMAVCPANGFNCYFQMPFRKAAKITVENRGDSNVLFYQVDYTLTEIDDDMAYFHAQYRRSHNVENGIHTLLDGVRGKGQYVGTFVGWQPNSSGWFGEGEVKFYLDGDGEFPTICGTGTEDYFGGAWNWDIDGQYTSYSTPYLGVHQIIKSDNLYNPQLRFGMYRWHICDPIRFESDLKVTIQALGWRSGGRYLLLKDDIISVSYWYQTEPHGSFPVFPSKDDVEVI
jgi:hypothetical protein